MERKPGNKLGPYELISAIGKGGMGEVWKGRDTRLNRDVAIKFCSNRFSDRFLREARAIAALNHPNICTLHDIGADYLVMEYIEGAPPHGPVAPAEAVRLALGIASALEAAHEKNITHRDLKPANVLVTRSGLKLLDFGLALINSDSGVGIADAPTALSVAGAVMGTVAYMSPEQAQGKPADGRSDIFSFGLVLYELLSGHLAFAGNSAGETMAAIMRDEPAPLDAPPKLSEIVMRCLRKAPAARFQTMSELRAALEQVNAARADETPSIAVLPFANMSRDPDDEYFSDGLAEEILNLLARIPGLKVTARTSSFAFRGKEEDIIKIAEALRVRNILEGSVRRAGTRIRVTAQLINAADGYHRWSERYDRELTDVFAVQDEIAAAIAAALKVSLARAPAPEQRHQPDLSAWEAFLKGRHQISRSSPDAFTRAKEYFGQAIALDPQFAAPHAELGVYYLLLGAQGLRPARDVMPLAHDEARKALALDASEPRAHTALCGVAALYDYDWKQASEHFQLAIAAESVPFEVPLRCALYHLLPLGRFAEAVRQFDTVLQQDPLSVLFRSAFCLALVCAGQGDRAVMEAGKALEIDESLWMTHFGASLGYMSLEKFSEARDSAERAIRLAPWQAFLPGMLAGIMARCGETQQALQLLAKRRDTSAVGLAVYHFLVGNIDAALDHYGDAIEQREPFAAMFAAAVFLKPLRENSRWPALQRMMKLPFDV
jgi:eukaryotic-like serine/threonine-protein kinase